MDLTAKENIDFNTLDIDKYLKWLRNEYQLFNRLWLLPFIEKKYENCLMSQYRTNLHYKATREEELPKQIKELYRVKLEKLQKEIKLLNDLPIKVIGFNSIVYSKVYNGAKYGFFTANELENVKIEVECFNSFLETFQDTWKPQFITELEDDFIKSPLPKENFYSQKTLYLKETNPKFKYLPRILKGEFIYNLNEFTECSNFFLELSVIWEISYLEKEVLKLKKRTKSTDNSHSLNPNFEDPKWQIKVIFDNTKDLFISDLSQWENLFSNDIQTFLKPIQLKDGVTLATLREFLDRLIQEKLIGKRGTLKTIANVNAFQYNNKPITPAQLSDATKTTNSHFYSNSDKIPPIFKALGMD